MKVRSLWSPNLIMPLPALSMIVLVGCAIPMELNFQNAPTTEFLDGHYQRLASCSFDRLGGTGAQLTKTDLPQRGRTVIASIVGSDKRWELAFINEDGGRQTRLEVQTGSGPYPGEHILALVRACAA
jgi:hypothetical protein